MLFGRSEFNADVAQLRKSLDPVIRARGDNIHFEENVGPTRLAHFEGFFEDFSPPLNKIRTAIAQYFDESVQGARRNHTPSTFQTMNGSALLPATIERVQKIVRVERIDRVLLDTGTDFTALQETVASGRKDPSIVGKFLAGFEAFPGARPAFACFRAEVATDLKQPDWLDRLCARLGLGHWRLESGEVAHFALMEYTVGEVFRQTALPQPFARPTVLECQDSEFFFPAPADSKEGYAVDLDHAAARESIREFLHMRIVYGSDHLKRVVQREGPTAPVDLVAARNAHLGRLRAGDGCKTYGEPMPTPGSL